MLDLALSGLVGEVWRAADKAGVVRAYQINDRSCLPHRCVSRYIIIITNRTKLCYSLALFQFTQNAYVLTPLIIFTYTYEHMHPTG